MRHLHTPSMLTKLQTIRKNLPGWQFGSRCQIGTMLTLTQQVSSIQSVSEGSCADKIAISKLKPLNALKQSQFVNQRMPLERASYSTVSTMSHAMAEIGFTTVQGILGTCKFLILLTPILGISKFSKIINFLKKRRLRPAW